MANSTRARRDPTNGSVSVSGPRYAKDRLPTVGAGISTALSAAGYSREDGTWYVREDDVVRYHVDRRGPNLYVTAVDR